MYGVAATPYVRTSLLLRQTLAVAQREGVRRRLPKRKGHVLI